MSRRPDTPSDELEELVSAFARWRATRRTLTGATPEPLRHRVVALLDTHRPATIARALSISPVAIERWASMTSTTNAPSATASPNFIALPPDDERPSGTSSFVTSGETLPELALRWPGGATLVARGAIPRTALAAILDAFTAPGANTPEGLR